MTRAEIRLAAAKKRDKEAQAALSRAYERQRAEREALTRKHNPRIWAAERKSREARAAVTVAELATHGIVPMETIIECKPWDAKHFGRYCVSVGRDGWPRLLAVGKTGKVLAGRTDKQSPIGWETARITGEKVIS